MFEKDVTRRLGYNIKMLSPIIKHKHAISDNVN